MQDAGKEGNRRELGRGRVDKEGSSQGTGIDSSQERTAEAHLEERIDKSLLRGWRLARLSFVLLLLFNYICSIAVVILLLLLPVMSVVVSLVYCVLRVVFPVEKKEESPGRAGDRPVGCRADQTAETMKRGNWKKGKKGWVEEHRILG